MKDWIKLHRAIRNHPLYADHAARTVFLHLLVIADDDGKGLISRFYTSLELGMKPGTFYDATTRLQQQHAVIQLKPNNKTTSFHILKWDQYQQQTNTKPTAAQQQTNTKPTLIKEEMRLDKKIDKSIGEAPVESIVSREDKRNPLVEHTISEFHRVYGFNPTDKKPRFVAHNLVQRIKTVTADRLGGELTQDRLKKGITVFFNWLQDQEGFEGIQKLETAKLKLNIFLETIPRKEHSASAN